MWNPAWEAADEEPAVWGLLDRGYRVSTHGRRAVEGKVKVGQASVDAAGTSNL